MLQTRAVDVKVLNNEFAGVKEEKKILWYISSITLRMIAIIILYKLIT